MIATQRIGGEPGDATGGEPRAAAACGVAVTHSAKIARIEQARLDSTGDRPS